MAPKGRHKKLRFQNTKHFRAVPATAPALRVWAKLSRPSHVPAPPAAVHLPRDRTEAPENDDVRIPPEIPRVGPLRGVGSALSAAFSPSRILLGSILFMGEEIKRGTGEERKE